MTKTHVTIDDTAWPLPNNNLEWTLRYGTPTKTDLLLAASILAAYSQIVLYDTQKQRNMVCSKIQDFCIEDALNDQT